MTYFLAEVLVGLLDRLVIRIGTWTSAKLSDYESRRMIKTDLKDLKNAKTPDEKSKAADHLADDSF